MEEFNNYTLKRKKKFHQYDLTKKIDIAKDNTQIVNVGEFITDKGVLYGVNRNIGRDIPWMNDGLVSVERRILYTLMCMDLKPNRPHGKISAIIGEMIKTLYPHGEKAPEGPLTRMARSFSTMLPYVDGSGNFGDPYTKEAASGRYIRARLSKYAYDCFFSETDVSSPIYDVKDNYNFNGKEPVYLPMKYPNVLMQWNNGIGSGIASNLCAFNSIDVMKTAIRLMDDPECKVEIYPDTPMKLNIVNKDELKNCFDQHKFSIKMEGLYDFATIPNKEKRKGDNHYIIFKSYPPHSSPVGINDSLTQLDSKGNKKFPEIIDINAKVNNGELEFFIEYTPGCDPKILAEKILKKTRFSDAHMTQFVLVKDNQTVRFTPRQVLLEWINIRIDQKRRYFHQKLIGIITEKSTVSALLKIATTPDGIEKAIKIIKSSKNDEEAISKICKAFDLIELEGKYIINLRIKVFNQINIADYQKRLETLEKEYKKYKNLSNEKAIREDMKRELEEAIVKYGRPRNAKLMNKNSVIEIPNENKILVYNDTSYYCLKTTEQLETISDKIDITYNTLLFNTRDKLIVFDEYGTCKLISGNSFSNTTSKPISMNNITNKNTKCVKIMKQIPDDNPDKYYTFITEKLFAKSVSYNNMKYNGRCIKMSEDDRLISVILTDKNGKLGLLSDDKLYYINMDKIVVGSSISMGRRIIKTASTVKNIIYINPDAEYLLLYGEYGYGKVMATRYMSYVEGSDNSVTMVNKKIYGAITLNNDKTFNIYDGSGHIEYGLHVKGTNAYIVNIAESENEGYKPTKVKIATSVGPSVKLFKYGRNQYYYLK